MVTGILLECGQMQEEFASSIGAESFMDIKADRFVQ